MTSCEEPKAAWDALHNHYERETLANKLLVKKRYFHTEMKEGTLVRRHLKYMKKLKNKLAVIGMYSNRKGGPGGHATREPSQELLHDYYCLGSSGYRFPQLQAAGYSQQGVENTHATGGCGQTHTEPGNDGALLGA